MSDTDDDFTSINELPDEHSDEAALARRVKHKIMHDTDDDNDDDIDHDDENDADDEGSARRKVRRVRGVPWLARIKARLFDLIAVFVLIVFLTWPSVQDVIEQFLGKSSTVAPVLAKAALGTLTFFFVRDFIDSQKKVF